MDTPGNQPRFDLRLLAWLGLAVLVGALLYSVAGALVPFVLACIIAYIGAPLVKGLEGRGLGRAAAAGVALLVLCAVLLLAPLLLVPVLAVQLAEVLQGLPAVVAKAQAWLAEQVPGLKAATVKEKALDLSSTVDFSGALPAVKNVLGYLGSSVTTVLSLVATVFLTPFIAFFLLRDWERSLARAHALLPQDLRPKVGEVAAVTDRVLSEFLRGQLSVMLIMATVYSVLLTVVGTPFSVALGTLTGMLSFIPYAGFSIGLTLTMIVTLVNFESWTVVAAAAGVLLAGTTFESYWLTPRIIGESVGMGPVAIIFAMTVMGAAFGFIGLLVAMPAAAIIVALWRTYSAHLVGDAG